MYFAREFGIFFLHLVQFVRRKLFQENETYLLTHSILLLDYSTLSFKRVESRSTMEYNDLSAQISSDPHARIRSGQVTLLAQLVQVTAMMRHIDELLSWLAQALTQRFGVQTVQLWTKQSYRTGEIRLELRAIAFPHQSLPHTVVVNNQIMEVVKYVLTKRQDVLYTPVEHAFPQQQAATLKQYRLNYCSGYYLSGNVLLPPASNSPFAKTPTPLAMAAILFLEHEPSPQLLPAVGQVLERVIPIAHNRGLLLSPQPAQQPPPLMVSELIPHYTDDEGLKSSNPFSSAVVIKDKQARRFYRQIDGQKKVSELTKESGLSSKEISAALRTLLDLRLIELRTSQGQVIDQSHILDTLD
jgi:hypothetical protein